MRRQFDIRITDLSVGWARVEFTLESQTVAFHTGHVGDPLAALLDAGRRVGKGVDADVVFFCEPEEYRLSVRCQGESVRIDLCERETDRTPNVSVRLSGHIPAAEFSRAVG